MSDDSDRPFKGEAKAIAAGLDLLVEMDEPGLLMRELEKLARARPGRWQTVADHAHSALEALEAGEAPQPKEPDAA